MDVLCREYTSVFCLDFSEKTLEILKLDPNANAYDLFVNEPQEKKNYPSVIQRYSDMYVADECREDFLNVMDIDNLKAKISVSDHFTYRYKSKPNKVLQSNFEIDLHQIDERIPDMAVLAIKNIDDIIRISNREAILNSLCNDYEVVYFCDLETDYLQVIKDSNPKVTVGAVYKFSEVVALFRNAKNLSQSASEYVRKLDKNYLMAYLSNHTEISLQFCINKSDGSQTFMETRVVRVKTDSGFKVILGSRHIDDIVREREERNRRLNEAVRNAQLADAAKTEFLQRMSHDIRTPLNGICGMIDIAEHYSDNPEKQRECLDKIKESANLLLEMVNEVLDMSKLESGKIILEQVPFNLYNTAEEVFEVIEKLAEERNIKVNCGGKGVTHWDVIGSPVHVKRIMMNIMSNAVKYNKEHGSIDLICKELPTDYEDTVLIQFICHDTGIGMSEEFRSHIFEPFSLEQIGEKIGYSRTGLGMSITKKLVDNMGGTIEVDSVKGKETTFKITIPFKIAGPDVRINNNPKENKADISGMNILIAEDNELNMEIAEFILQNGNANVTKAWNGKEAVSIFENSVPGTFDVILMDIMMPVMDGYEAAKMIRASDRDDAAQIPIIAMTANAFTEDKLRARKAGMNDHISKPVSGEKLIRMLSELSNKN